MKRLSAAVGGTYVVRNEKELEARNEKLTAQLADKTASIVKLCDQLQSSQTDLSRLKSELARVSQITCHLAFCLLFLPLLWILGLFVLATGAPH